MRTYKEVVKIDRQVADILCNSCGKRADEKDTNGRLHEWSCTIKVSYTNHGPFPGQDSGTITYEVCRKCLREKIEPLLSHLPPNEVRYDQDSGKTIVTP